MRKKSPPFTEKQNLAELFARGVSNQFSVDAVAESEDRLTADGWTMQSPGIWRKRFDRASDLPLPEVKGIIRRTVWDVERGAVIDRSRWPQTIYKSENAKLRRNLRQRRDLDVEVEVSAVEEDAVKTWEDQDMSEADGQVQLLVN